MTNEVRLRLSHAAVNHNRSVRLQRVRRADHRSGPSAGTASDAGRAKRALNAAVKAGRKAWAIRLSVLFGVRCLRREGRFSSNASQCAWGGPNRTPARIGRTRASWFTHAARSACHIRKSEKQPTKWPPDAPGWPRIDTAQSRPGEPIRVTESVSRLTPAISH